METWVVSIFGAGEGVAVDVGVMVGLVVEVGVMLAVVVAVGGGLVQVAGRTTLVPVEAGELLGSNESILRGKQPARRIRARISKAKPATREQIRIEPVFRNQSPLLYFIIHPYLVNFNL